MATRRKRSINFLPAEPRSEPAIDISVYPVNIGVGELMRLTRERLGHELQSVANQLRIRLSYLEAIEESRFRDLPGTTYAIGFVRSYADYLGLDGPDIVRRFREEAARIHGKTKLVFPALTVEGKIPRAAVLLVSVVALGLAYTAWYVLSSQRNTDVPVIAEVPDRLIALTPGTDEVADVPPSPGLDGAVSTPPAPLDPTATQGLPGDDRSGSASAAAPASPSDDDALPQPDAASVPPSAVPASPVPIIAAPGDSTAPADRTATATVDVPPPPQVAATTPPSSPDLAATPVPGRSDDPVAPEVTAPDIPAAPSAPPPALQEQPQQVAVVGGAKGVVLEARMDSWIKVIDASGKTLVNQVLKAGERYVVPDQPGLILRTGNAGGLDVLVGGQKTPPLGDVGEVHQKIRLDPDRLLSGTAGSD